MKFERLPLGAGIGFKPSHYKDLDEAGAVSWLEVHAENYMLDGGPRRAMLAELSERFAISAHGVGLSIGGEGRLDPRHLNRLKDLMDWLKPAQFSEHLAWSSHGGAYYNDLLPLPYTQSTLTAVCDHIDQVQDALGRQMLLENPSSYLSFAQSTLSETDFLREVAERTGCGMLLDINNVFISATNLGQAAEDYLDVYPLEQVGEIHLAGYHAQDIEGGTLLIDSHSAEVSAPVWALYERTIAKIGPRPTLIEWDNDVPDFATLEREAAKANAILQAKAAA